MSDPVPADDPVITVLEDYLRQAGLFAVIAEHRRQHVLRWPAPFTKDSFWAFVWLSIFWIPEIGTLFVNHGLSGMKFALLAPPATLLGYALLLGLISGTMLLSKRVRSLARTQAAVSPPPLKFSPPPLKDRESLQDKKMQNLQILMVLGLLIGTPAMLAVTVWFYISTAAVAACYFGFYVALAVGLFLLVSTRDVVLYRLYVVKAFISMTWQIIRQIFRHLPAIGSVLLVIVLFSIFSTEFWEALGNLTPAKFVACIALLIALPLAFALSSLSREAEETIKIEDGGTFLRSVIIEPALENKFIKKRLDEDLLKSEDWAHVEPELAWRATSKLCENILPILRRHATWWLAVLLTSTVIFLFVAFFIYFSVLFFCLIDPALLAKWLRGGQSVDAVGFLRITVPYLGWQLELPSTIEPMAKVALLLSAFIAMMSMVYVLTDENIKKRFTDGLSGEARYWIALSCIYRNLISPGYQIWSSTICRKGVASVSIVARKGSAPSTIKTACTDVRTHLQKQRKLVVVTVFEQIEDETAYSYGMPGKCWQMVFEPEAEAGEPVEVVPPVNAKVNGKQNESWFGNTARAQEQSRILREKLPELHHAYVFDGAHFLNFVVRREKLASGLDYLNLMKTILAGLNTPDLFDLTISVYVYNKDTQEELAFLLYSRHVGFIAYRDAFNGRIRFLKRRKLIPAQA